MPSQFHYTITGEQLEQLLNVLASLREKVAQNPLNPADLQSAHESLERWAWSVQLRSSALLAERAALQVAELNRQLQKQVELKVNGFNVDIDHSTFDVFASALLHSVRNAFAHGIETSGTIEAWLFPQKGRVHLIVEDNGRGPDLTRIRARAVERRLVLEANSAELTEDAWLEFLFAPGFSTLDSVDEIAGRGMGLDAVRAQVLSQGGEIQASRAPSGGFRLTLHSPLRSLGAEVVLARVGNHRLYFPRSSLVRMDSEPSDLERESLRRWCEFIGVSGSGLQLWKLIDHPSVFPVPPRVIGFDSVGAHTFQGFRKLDPVWKTAGPEWLRVWWKSWNGDWLATAQPELAIWVDPGHVSGLMPI